MTHSRISLAKSIESVRAARDELAHRAEEASELGASGLSDVLAAAAAGQDRLLAELLRQDAKLQYKAEHLPGR